MKNKTDKKNNIAMKLAKSLSLFLLLLVIVMNFAVPAFAQSISDVLGQIGTQSQLPSFETAGHASSSYESGASNITSAIFYVVDLLKYALGTVAVVMIIFIGVKLITTGKNIGQTSPKMKEALKYVLIGLVVVMVAEPLVTQVFFGQQGEVYRSEADVKLAAQRGTDQLRGLYNFFEYFLGAIAVLMIVIYGVRMVASQGNEDVLNKSKKGIMWAIAGIMLVGVSELLVKGIIFPNEGSKLSDVNAARELIVNITNFVSGFMGTVAIAMFMYAGYMYVTAAGQEAKVGKAKKVLIGAVIGLLVAMGAFAIVNNIIKLEPAASTLGGENAPATLPTNPQL
jgi:hypothetical protein